VHTRYLIGWDANTHPPPPQGSWGKKNHTQLEVPPRGISPAVEHLKARLFFRSLTHGGDARIIEEVTMESTMTALSALGGEQALEDALVQSVELADMVEQSDDADFTVRCAIQVNST
jgi:hypothetical protein